MNAIRVFVLLVGICVAGCSTFREVQRDYSRMINGPQTAQEARR